MSKTQTKSTLTPLAFVSGQAVTAQDIQAVAEQLNWTAGYRTSRVHFSLNTAGNEWGAGVSNEIHTLGLHVPDESAGWKRQLRHWILVSPDAVTLKVGARMVVYTGETVEVRFGFSTTVGGAITWATTLSFTDADVSEKTTTIATSSSGTGWLVCHVDFQRTATLGGTHAGKPCWARNLRCQSLAVTSSLPSPPNS